MIFGHTVTVVKYRLPNTSYTIWYCNICKRVTVIKCAIANTNHAIWYYETCEGIAVIKYS